MRRLVGRSGRLMTCIMSLSNRRAIKLQIEDLFQEVLDDLERFTPSELRTYAIRLVLDARYYMLRLCRRWTFSWPRDRNSQADFLFAEFGKMRGRGAEISCRVDIQLTRLAIIVRDELSSTSDRLRAVLLLLAARKEYGKLFRAEVWGIYIA